MDDTDLISSVSTIEQTNEDLMDKITLLQSTMESIKIKVKRIVQVLSIDLCQCCDGPQGEDYIICPICNYTVCGECREIRGTDDFCVSCHGCM